MSKEIVRLRQKQLKDGSASLYLDIYVNGQRKYEFLKLYLVPEKTKGQKMMNKETMRLAEAVKAQRIVEIERCQYDFNSDTKATFDKCMEEFIASEEKLGRCVRKDVSIRKILFPEFGMMRLSKFTKATMQDIKDTLFGLDLEHNTKVRYFSRVKTALRRAADKGNIRLEIVRSVPNEGLEDVVRQHLTLEELKRLVNQPCKYPEIKRAFLFACLTGLRSVDIKALTWDEIEEVNGFTRIVFRQIKTKKQEYMDIMPQAAELLGERGVGYIFDLGRQDVYNPRLKKWVRSASIMKRITFHCARHTFACLLLEMDTNIAVIQNLLGHKKLDTTMIYAKVVDKSKREAVMRIPNIFGKKD